MAWLFNNSEQNCNNALANTIESLINIIRENTKKLIVCGLIVYLSYCLNSEKKKLFAQLSGHYQINHGVQHVHVNVKKHCCFISKP